MDILHCTGTLCVRISLIGCVLVASIIGMPAVAKEWQENKSWNAHFTEHKSQGVVVLWNENKQQGFTNNLKRRTKHFTRIYPLKFPIA